MADRNETLQKREDESELAFIYRICHLKSSVAELESWEDVKTHLNRELKQNYGESYYRKKVQEFDKLFAELKETFLNDEYVRMLETKRELLYKQQVKTGDKLREYRKHLRDEARVEVLRGAVKTAAKELQGLGFERDIQINIPQAEGDNEAVLLISDWHVGAQFRNFRNSYDLDIARARVMKLTTEVIRHCRLNGVTSLRVVNLGDMVEGNIHVSTRVQSEVDVVQQLIKAYEYIYLLLGTLAESLPETTILYHQSLDNHSRVTANYKEHIEAENFAKLGIWWLKERVESENKTSSNPIYIIEDEIDDNIGLIEFKNGKKAAFVHGHLDKIDAVLANLMAMLDIRLDYVFMGHFHYAKMQEYNGGKVFVNGSLKGMDDYSLKNRYVKNASQTLLIQSASAESNIIITLN